MSYINVLMLKDVDFNRAGRVVTCPVDLATKWVAEGIAEAQEEFPKPSGFAPDFVGEPPEVATEPEEENSSETPEAKPKGRPLKK